MPLGQFDGSTPATVNLSIRNSNDSFDYYGFSCRSQNGTLVAKCATVSRP
jgi:hypothetical protein